MNEKLLELAKEALCEPVAWRYKWDKNLEWHYAEYLSPYKDYYETQALYVVKDKS